MVIFIFLIVAFYFFISHLLYRRTQKDINKTLLLASILYIFLTFYQNLFNHMTCNQDVNGYAFIGIMLATGTGLSMELLNLKFLKMINRKIVLAVFYGLLSFALIYVGFRGIEISLHRKVQDIFSGSKFPSYCAVEKLKNLRWGKPTTIDNTDIEEQSIINLIVFLQRTK